MGGPCDDVSTCAEATGARSERLHERAQPAFARPRGAAALSLARSVHARMGWLRLTSPAGFCVPGRHEVV
jgi:hypothetical protein